MLDFSRDIHSLTDFKTRTPKFLAQLKKPERAILLTINGKAELAVMSAATFQRLLDRLEIHVSGNAFKQDIHCTLQQDPSAREHPESYANGD